LEIKVVDIVDARCNHKVYTCLVLKNNGSINNRDIVRIWRVLSQQIPGKFLLFNQQNSILLSTRDSSIKLCV